MVRTAKKKAPSRVRYEQSHPVVSCRVPKDVYDRLQAAKEMEGKSFTDILKVGLGMIEVGAKKEEEAAKLGFIEGHMKGYTEAEHEYKVDYPCNLCGKMLTITSEASKKVVRAYMLEHGWGHRECHEGGR